ncbi:GAF domain-containing sensor histidine kinase [Desulforamulus aquiferis]|uniref:GAF domain-containing sensor histidine kinase n=1 Tax=Desulforamulus aquiferis TaxID=1397668 RepID=UPI002714CEFD|nr:GAF domain-containing protein [Desulforamulus aquiferis]
MAQRLRAVNRKGQISQANQAIGIMELFNQREDIPYPNDLLVKNSALERLGGVKNSAKTHYSELKKSVAQMQKCNINLTKSQREIEGLYQLLKKKADQTLAILDVSRAVSNILPFDQILQKTSTLVSQVLGPVECALYSARQGMGKGEEAWSSVIKNKLPQKYSEHYEKGPHFLALPLFSRGNVIGVLSIKREGELPFTQEEVELCTGIASPVAVAIENRTLVEKLEKESLRLKTALLSLKVMSDNLAMLNQGVEPLLLAIGESLLEITDAQYAVLLTRTDKLVSIHVPKPLPEKQSLDDYFSSWLDQLNAKDLPCLYGIGSQQLKDDTVLDFLPLRYGLKNIVAFPMITREKILGLILLLFNNYRGDEGCQSILQILGNQTAIVLENARLFEDTIYLKDNAESHYKIVCQQKEQLEQKNQELKNMYNILFRAREEQILSQERNRIAGDLHDNVLQILFAIGLHFEWCFSELSTNSPVYAKLKYLEDLVNKAVQEIRKVICEFSTLEASLSLRDSIEGLVRDLNQAGSVQICVNTFGKALPLPSVVRNIAYRIVQEALVNSLRHASASRIDVNISFGEKRLEILVWDNGVGIPENTIESLSTDDKKFGLKNMLQRAQYLNGILKVGRSKSGGVEIMAVIPIEGVEYDG